MIEFIKGKVDYKGEDFLVLECGGIGYKIFVSAETLLNAGYDEIKIYTYMSVSETGIALYGFLTGEELKLFYKLITVSGVGPKSAIGLLNVLSPSQIIFAIVAEDVKTIAMGQGIGKKTAQRIILELRDKLAGEAESVGEAALTEMVSNTTGRSGEKAEAIEALVALGFGRSEAAKAVGAVYTEGMTTEDAVKLGLKALA